MMKQLKGLKRWTKINNIYFAEVRNEVVIEKLISEPSFFLNGYFELRIQFYFTFVKSERFCSFDRYLSKLRGLSAENWRLAIGKILYQMRGCTLSKFPQNKESVDNYQRFLCSFNLSRLTKDKSNSLHLLICVSFIFRLLGKNVF